MNIIHERLFWNEHICRIDYPSGATVTPMTSVVRPTSTTSRGASLAWVDGNYIYVRSSYDVRRVADAKSIEGRWWDGEHKRDRFPVSSAAEVFAHACRWRIVVHASLEAIVGDVTESKGLTGSYIYNLQVRDGQLVFDFTYSAEMVGRLVMAVPGARWSKRKGAWLAPAISLEKAVTFAEKMGFTIDPDIANHLDELVRPQREMLEASHALDADIEIPGLNGELLPFQRAGVVYLRKCRKGILGDEQGLGKSLQALATTAVENAYPLVVICPQTMRYVWADEIEKWFPDLTYSVVTGMTPTAIPPSDVVIVNYDILTERADDIIAHGYESVAVDESHFIKNGERRFACPNCGAALKSNSVNCKGCSSRVTPIERWTVKRAGAVSRIANEQSDDDLCLLLTGTPITNRPMELVPQLQVTRWLEKLFGSKWRFQSRYAPDKNVARNTKELNDVLRQNCYIRRTKAEVYGELPPVINSNVFLEPSGESMDWYRECEADVIGYFANKAREIAEESGNDGTAEYFRKRMQLQYAEHLVRLSALRGAAAKIKEEETLKWVAKFLEDNPDKKLIVFAEHIEIVEKIWEANKDVAVKIRGGVSSADRRAAVKGFQDDPSIRLFVGNMKAAGQGLTLTAAYDVVFCELDWTPAQHDQCVARAYGRVNDLHGATAHYLLVHDTIDMEIVRLLDKKRKIVNAVTEGHDIDPEADQSSSIMELATLLANRGLKEGL